MGQVLQAGVGQAPARQAALRAGLPNGTSATTINRVCGSGLKAIMLAAAEIRAGDAEVVVAGGMESMNGAPYLLPGARFGLRLGNGELIDATVHDGLWCAIEDCHMGTHAERVAISDDVSREDQDAFALASHQKAIAAIDAGRFDAEMAPVTVRDAKGRETIVTVDEGPRRDSIDRGAGAAASRPSRCPTARTAAPRPMGTVTAGNAPGITDGAAATVVASERAVERLGLTPLARIVGYAQAEVEPKWLFLAPIEGVRRLLDRIEMPIEAFDLIEINEAFAAQTLADGRALGFDWDEGQRQRRRDRARPPDRRERRADRRNAASTSWRGATVGTALRPSASAAAVRSRWPSNGSDPEEPRPLAEYSDRIGNRPAVSSPHR